MTTGPRPPFPTAPRPPRTASAARRPRGRLRTAAALACVGAALLSGCGLLPGHGDEDEGPVTVMTWAPQKSAGTNLPGMTATARAVERWVNAQGGINGRQLRVLTCDERGDAVAAASCARRAVREKAVAVVGSYSEHGDAVLSPLAIAGIPYIGGYGITPEEFTDPVSYPVNGGLPALLAGQGGQLAGACAKVSLVRPDTIVGDPWARLMGIGLAAHGGTVADLPVSADLSDYTPQAQQALDRARTAPGGRGCVTAVLGGRTATFFDSFRRLRPEGPGVRISSVLGSVDQALLDRSGGASGPYEGASVTGWYPAADDPRWEPMREVVKKYAFGDNRVDPSDAGVQTTWVAYTVLRAAVASLKDGPVTAATVRKALDSGLNVTTGGLTPTLNWRTGEARTVIDYPRMINPRVTYQTVHEGRLQAPTEGPTTTDTTKTLETAR
ncbi:ABC transporter substrate-binding protein [Streptomyces sp. NPDC049954]|uniref:ABC transporter substrate-binding protein n=1 Tax=Streptomyces sp. NPDC049954 TaxID=3155779 RepID=UPI003445E24A